MRLINFVLLALFLYHLVPSQECKQLNPPLYTYDQQGSAPQQGHPLAQNLVGFPLQRKIQNGSHHCSLVLHRPWVGHEMYRVSTLELASTSTKPVSLHRGVASRPLIFSKIMVESDARVDFTCLCTILSELQSAPQNTFKCPLRGDVNELPMMLPFFGFFFVKESLPSLEPKGCPCWVLILLIVCI